MKKVKTGFKKDHFYKSESGNEVKIMSPVSYLKEGDKVKIRVKGSQPYSAWATLCWTPCNGLFYLYFSKTNEVVYPHNEVIKEVKHLSPMQKALREVNKYISKELSK